MKDETLERTKELIESEPELTGRDLTVLKYMLQDLSVKQICHKMGLGRTTIWSITSQPHWKKALRQTQGAIVNSALASLAGESRALSGVLLEIALDPKQSASNRIQSVKLAFNSIQNMANAMEFKERLEALENAILDL